VFASYIVAIFHNFMPSGIRLAITSTDMS